MTNTTYSNVTLVDVPQDEAATWLADNAIEAAISPVIDDMTVVYDNILASSPDEDEPLEALLKTSSEISYELGCAAWLVIVDQNDVLIYSLFIDGTLVDSYGVKGGEAPDGGNAEKLADLFEAPKRQIKAIRNILNRPLNRSQESASERHQKLLKALSLPGIAAGYGFAEIIAQDIPDAFSIADVIIVSSEDNEESPE